MRQLSGYGQQLDATMVAPAVDDVRTQRVGAGPVRPVLDRPSRSHVPRWVAVASAAAAVVIIGGVLVIVAVQGGQSPVVDQPTNTTINSRPSTSLPTSVDVSVPLTPSGLEVVASGPEFFGSVVSDASGVIWGYGPAGLLRYDHSIDETTRWTVADDAWFDPGIFADIAPARDGGVWLYGSLVVRFDGTTFAEVIEVPGLGDTYAMAEASDGTLWASVQGAGLLQWNGSAWFETAVAVSADSLVAADDLGGVWVTEATLETAPGDWSLFAVVRYDGTQWVGYEVADLGVDVISAIHALAIEPGGNPWLATEPRGGQGPRLFSLHSGTWSTHVLPGPATSLDPTSVAIGPDGTVWAAFVDDYDGDLMVARFAGQTWTTYGPESGLDASGWVIADLAVTADGVFLGRGPELLELVDGEWMQVLPDPEAMTLYGLDLLLPVSDDEVWGVDWDTVWHYGDGVWEQYSAPDGLPAAGIQSLTLGPAGTVWVATDEGVAYLDGNRWTVVDEGPADAVASRSRGPVFASGGFAADDSLRMVAFERVEGTWTATPIEQPPLDIIDSMAVGVDGSVWIGSHGGGWTLPGKGMARYHEGVWEVIDHIGTSTIEMVGDIAVAPNGDVWTIVTARDGRGPFVVQYDGSEWTIHEGVLLVPGHDGFDLGHRLWIDATGVVYVLRPNGAGLELVVFEGVEWTVRSGDLPYLLTIGPDGSIWAWEGNLLRYPAG